MTRNNTGSKRKNSGKSSAASALQTILSGLNEMMQRPRAFTVLYIALGILTAVLLFVAAYFWLVPVSLHSSAFKTLIVGICLLWSVPLVAKFSVKAVGEKIKIGYKIPLFIGIGVIIICILLGIATTPLFIASKYRGLITIDENEHFTSEIEDYTQMKIPIVDKALAMKLGEKRLGEDNLGSQYTIENYTIIEYKDDLYWVGAIEYDGFFKWSSERGGGSPGYVLISATDPSLNVELVRKPTFYMPNAYFGEDLERKLYFNKMGLVRDGRINFELDEDGTPYYTQAVVKKKFAFTNGRDAYGIFVLNAVTGECKFYTLGSQPDWVDRVIPTEIANEQIDFWGRYKHGYFNTLFAKKEVLSISEGYNYVHHNGELYLYTGVTSVGKDESIVGVVMCNLKNKKTDFYKISGATEYAAQQSAQGIVQDLRYYASFPCLINYGGEPTYFMTLKDNEGLIKKFAYVNVRDYTKVGIGDTMVDAQVSYNQSINISVDYETLTVSDVREVIIDGNSVFYVKFAEKGDEVFKANIKLNDKLPFVKIGDTVKVRISENIISEIVIE